MINEVHLEDLQNLEEKIKTEDDDVVTDVRYNPK
jgi:hypothetical protein